MSTNRSRVWPVNILIARLALRQKGEIIVHQVIDNFAL